MAAIIRKGGAEVVADEYFGAVNGLDVVVKFAVAKLKVRLLVTLH
ncbi:MAG: hypothetical protein V7K48_15180 [Nostoc sp.]